MATDYPAIASAWLQSFGTALAAGDIRSVTECFSVDGYLRDVLVFTWKNRTLSGRAKIAAYLDANVKPAAIAHARLDTRTHLTPQFGHVTHAAMGVSSGFTFETAVGPGQGYFSLVQDGAGEWKALIVFMTLADIRGHEESGPDTGVYGGHTLAWHDVHRARRQEIERDPHVLISSYAHIIDFAVLTWRSWWWPDWSERRGPIQADEHPESDH